MPPKIAEYAAKYASKTRRKSQKTADLDQQQPFYCLSKTTLAEKFERFRERFLA